MNKLESGINCLKNLETLKTDYKASFLNEAYLIVL